MIRPTHPDGTPLTIREQLERRGIKKAKRADKAATLWKKKAPRVRSGSLWKFWRDRCDGLVKLLARRRDGLHGGLCRICGSRPVQVGYHVIPCGRYATRWDPRNVVGACAPCNRGEQLNRLSYVDKHRVIFGALYDELLEKSRGLAKFSVDELQALAASLLSQIEAVK